MMWKFIRREFPSLLVVMTIGGVGAVVDGRSGGPFFWGSIITYSLGWLVGWLYGWWGRDEEDR